MKNLFGISFSLTLALVTPTLTNAQANPASSELRCVITGSTILGSVVNQYCGSTPPHSDAIYQNGYEVGTMDSLKIIDAATAEGAVEGGRDFDMQSDFIFQNMRLHIKSCGTVSSIRSPGNRGVGCGYAKFSIVRPAQ